MANTYNAANSLYSSSSQREPDEISLFLQQILLRSASSSNSYLIPQQSFVAAPSEPENRESVAIYAAQASSRFRSSSYCSLENEQDEYEYESEEAVEATALKPTPRRSPSKRSRAPEVHNLSEKRRRSRINEKMKALQNLIPNSNKTDKASMLDEAIEYLKQLQLQVQMLTMRNGLSLYPICLPGIMQPNQLCQVTTNMSDSEEALNANMGKTSMVDQASSVDALLSLRDNCAKQELVADLSSMMGSRPPFEINSSLQDHLGQFPVSMFSEENLFPHQRPNNDHPQTSSTGKEHFLGDKVQSSNPFGTQSSDLEETNLEACPPARDHLLSSVAKPHHFHH